MITNLTNKQKVNAVRIIAILSTLAMMLYAPELWITEKDFPVIPLFDWIPIPTSPFDTILAGLFFVSQVVYIFKPKRLLGWFVLLLYIYLGFVDQNRLQPYFYQSFLTILAIVIYPKNTEAKKVLFTIILIFIATYLWSGIHKLNGIFYEQWMHALVKHFSFIPEKLLLAFTYAVPWLEALLGIFILSNKTRKLGIYGIVIMHSIIIVMLLYLGYGFNVIPWNLQNILSVLIIFWTLKTTSFFEVFRDSISYQKGLIFIFTFILPFSNLFGGWDHLLSFSFFTSKLDYYYVQIDDSLKDKLPENIQKYYRTNEHMTVLYLNEWAGDVNKVLLYPQPRVAKKVEQYMLSFANETTIKNPTKLVVYNK
tara:strand:+ start:4913 stop:6010 length:1098 start_codon:yes stop_codon:yes gene_type:complete